MHANCTAPLHHSGYDWQFSILSYDDDGSIEKHKRVHRRRVDNQLLHKFTVIDTQPPRGSDGDGMSLLSPATRICLAAEYWRTLRWLLTHTDLTLFVFDAGVEQPEISEQLRQLIGDMPSNKYRLVLNKADQGVMTMWTNSFASCSIRTANAARVRSARVASSALDWRRITATRVYCIIVARVD